MRTHRPAKDIVVELPVPRLLFVKYVRVRLINMGIVLVATANGAIVSRRWLWWRGGWPKLELSRLNYDLIIINPLWKVGVHLGP
jgi:hypothetical protein